MSSSTCPSNRGPEFCDPLRSPVSRYIGEYNSGLDARHFATMRENVVALKIQYCNNVTRFTTVVARVKRWLHCSGRRLSVSSCVSTIADMTFVRCDEKVEYERVLLELIRLHSG